MCPDAQTGRPPQCNLAATMPHPSPSMPDETSASCRISADGLILSGQWTARGIPARQGCPALPGSPGGKPAVVDATQIDAIDSVGAWLLQSLLLRLRAGGAQVSVHGLRPEFAQRLRLVEAHWIAPTVAPVPAGGKLLAAVQAVGRQATSALEQGIALLAFIGESAAALARCAAQPRRLRWRPVLYNIRSAGFDALPIVGLLAFLLGVVIAYQGAEQLRNYGANIFVVDLVGLSMLREFAPLITAIIVAGRSGSAYAAQIGTMSVSEEIDAMRTIGIEPLEQLVLPKVLALLLVLPLLTVFADIAGVFGGMIMARAQLGVGFEEFLDRLAKAVSVNAYLLGIGKAPVFAAIIAAIGCFQGLRTTGGADGVGRQTTRSVVQSIFLVIVADGLFSVVFSALHL